jgi:hypothetical protein
MMVTMMLLLTQDHYNCRNLVQFYGACIAEGNLMLVLEYMDGQLPTSDIHT